MHNACLVNLKTEQWLPFQRIHAMVKPWIEGAPENYEIGRLMARPTKERIYITKPWTPTNTVHSIYI